MNSIATDGVGRALGVAQGMVSMKAGLLLYTVSGLSACTERHGNGTRCKVKIMT